MGLGLGLRGACGNIRIWGVTCQAWGGVGGARKPKHTSVTPLYPISVLRPSRLPCFAALPLQMVPQLKNTKPPPPPPQLHPISFTLNPKPLNPKAALGDLGWCHFFDNQRAQLCTNLNFFCCHAAESHRGSQGFGLKCVFCFNYFVVFTISICIYIYTHMYVFFYSLNFFGGAAGGGGGEGKRVSCRKGS